MSLQLHTYLCLRWRDLTPVSVAGTLQSRSPPFVSVTMELPGGSPSDLSSFWSNIYNQSPIKPRPPSLVNGFHMNGFAREPLPSPPWHRVIWSSGLRCVRTVRETLRDIANCTCKTPAPARVYGAPAALSPPTQHSDSPPYLPSGPDRNLHHGASRPARTNGLTRQLVRDLPV